MKLVRAIAAVFMMCMGAHVARADLYVGTSFLDQGFASRTFDVATPSVGLAISPGLARGQVTAVAPAHTPTGFLESARGDVAFLPTLAQSLEAPYVPRSSPRVVKELPPGPSSAGLFLSGMLSLGVWQLTRSARHLHLGALPEWYHAGCPAQIAHTVPFDLRSDTLILSWIDSRDADVGRRPFLFRVPQDQRPRFNPLHACLAVVPRGPPLRSF